MGRKIAVWVLAFCLLAAGGALIAGKMALSGVAKGEPLGITLYECGSEMDGIFLEADGYSWGTQQTPPMLTMRWINKGTQEITFGADFDVLYKERGEWVSCARGDGPFVDAIAYFLKPGEQMRMQYPLDAFDMSRTGDYRFRVCPDGEHALWFDFALRYKD